MNDKEYINLIDTFRHDYEFYAEQVLRIKTKKGGELVPFKFNRIQRRLWRDYILPDLLAGKPLRYIILKARQEGVSTFIAGFKFWVVTLNKNRGGIIVAHTQDAAENLFDKIKVFFKCMPEGLKPMRKISNRKELHFANPDDNGPMGLESRVLVQTAESSELGRSFTFQLAHLSEFASWEILGYDPGIRMSALNQSIPYLPGTAVFIETTAQGEGVFKAMWENEKNYYTKVFIPWVADEDYRIETSPLEYLDLSEIEDSEFGNEEEEAELIREQLIEWYPEWNHKTAPGMERIDHEVRCRIAWRRFAIINNCEGNVNKFRQEYPTTPQQAFISTGSGIFPARPLNDMKKRLPIGKCFRYNNSVEDLIDTFGRRDPGSAVSNAFESRTRGPLIVFEPPSEGARYVIGIDTAEGVEGGDPSAAIILRCPELVEVAVYNSITPPAEMAYIGYCLGHIYNKALIGVEVNEQGGAAVLNLLQRRLFYPNLYWRQIFDTSTNRQTQQKYGWKTTATTKPIMISDLQQALRDEDICLSHIDTIKQCLEYKLYPDGHIGIKAPGHDDLCVALMISVQMAKQIHIALRKEEQRTRKYTFKWWADQVDREPRPRRNYGEISG